MLLYVCKLITTDMFLTTSCQIHITLSSAPFFQAYPCVQYWSGWALLPQ